MVISAITKNKFSSVAASDIPVVRRFRGALTQRLCHHFILSSSAVLSFLRQYSSRLTSLAVAIRVSFSP